MVNKNYRRGYVIEHRYKAMREKEGFTCFRTAGSHGVVDIICLRSDKGLLTQLKRSKTPSYSNKEAELSLQAFQNYDKKYFIKELAIWNDKKGSKPKGWFIKPID